DPIALHGRYVLQLPRGHEQGAVGGSRQSRMAPPRFRVLSFRQYERHVQFRMPFRFGVVTLTAAPQAFLRTRIRLDDGRESEGAAAEMLAPKWFDKNPALTNEQNFDQLRLSLALAREAYTARDA